MATDLLALSSRIIDAGVDDGERTNPTTGELSEVAPGIALFCGFGHVVAIQSADGVLVFDTSSLRFAPAAIAALRTWSDRAINTIVYTHGHIDHVGGAATFLADCDQRGHSRPPIVAHENVARRFLRYDKTNRYNAIVNARQFGPTRLEDFKQPRFMTGFVHPDIEYRDRLTIRVGDLLVHLHHTLGETDDHTWAWVPARRAICSGDLLTWVFPNAGNPQKVQRYPREWAQALREMSALEPELLLPAHGLPIAGKDRIARVLDEVATALEHLVDETIERMNAGQRLDTIIHAVTVPSDLLARPWLRPIYDEPEFVIRNIWRLYGGWYDGNPAHLKPSPDAELAAEVARMAGGSLPLARRSLELSRAGNHRLACHLVEMAALVDPSRPEVHRIRAEVYEARAASEPSLMARGIFRSAAEESRSAQPDA